MRVTLIGNNPPGRVFCRPDASIMDNVHVGVQIRRNPAELIAADQAHPRWEIDVESIHTGADLDFRGPAVQGKRGERFIYLTWGNLGPAGEFEMFRRAKLMLNRVAHDVMATAITTGHLEARIDLTGGDGGPRCARVDPPAIEWSATPS